MKAVVMKYISAFCVSVVLLMGGATPQGGPIEREDR